MKFCYLTNHRVYRNHRGLSETLRSRLDSHQTAMAKRARPVGHKIVISNLEPSVTSEDIRVSMKEMMFYNHLYLSLYLLLNTFFHLGTFCRHRRFV